MNEHTGRTASARRQPRRQQPDGQRPGRGGRQQEKSRQMRGRLVEAAIACLAETGFERTSIKRVVARAGVSQGALQHHFPTKEDLIVAVVDRLLERSISETLRFVDEERGNPRAVEAITMRIWTHLIDTKPYRALLEILMAARTDEALRVRVAPNLQRWNAAIDALIIRLFRARDGRQETAEALLFMGRSMMMGLVVSEGFFRDRDYARAMVERWIALTAPLIALRPAGEPAGDSQEEPMS